MVPYLSRHGPYLSPQVRLSLRALAAEEEGGGASGLVSLRICAETDDLAGRGGRAPFEGEEAAAAALLSRLAPGSGVAEAERHAWLAYYSELLPMQVSSYLNPNPNPNRNPSSNPTDAVLAAARCERAAATAAAQHGALRGTLVRGDARRRALDPALLP